MRPRLSTRFFFTHTTTVSALSGDYSNPHSGGLWHSLNRFLLTLIAVTIATVVGYRALPEVSKRREQEQKIEALKAEIDRQKQLYAMRSREENLLRHDPEYIGLIARDRLDLMRDGEKIYRIEPPKPDLSKFRLNR